MSLSEWLKNGWLKPYQPNPQKIRNMLNLIRRDLRDCQSTEISTDWRFAIAYNAALTSCLIALHCRGYEVTRGQSEHYRAIQSLTLTMGEEFSTIKNYMNACRNKRNISDYESAGTVSETEAQELFATASDLFTALENWLRENYPEMI
ncbi:MAG: hypothetical protein COT43_00695 [Candidatus Marinimicrobia bacterium CG08_land_8_20_14_0_20_45_22]|nr:MAG: hypothetical protein COT43_00695 [Candidatus Marinimicrobia bacterium CG08_land_8_20_14_0_20_45_22]